MTQIINKKLYNMKSLYAKKLSMYVSGHKELKY